MSKVLTIAGVSILALGLVLGLALPGLAAPDVAATPWANDFQTSMVRGKVLSVDEGKQEFVIQSGEQEPTIKVDDNTKYHKLCLPGRIVSLARHQTRWRHQNLIPQLDNGDLREPKRPKLKWLRPFGEGAEFSDIAVDDRVVVWLATEDNNLAKRVLIIKPTSYARVSGTIIDVSSGEKTITIAPEDGEAVTLYYNEGTVFILKGIILLEAEVEPFARAVYNTETTMAKVVWICSEAPQLGD